MASYHWGYTPFSDISTWENEEKPWDEPWGEMPTTENLLLSGKQAGLLLKMAIEIVDLPIKNGDFP